MCLVTRELKLSLILGFSLVLIVTVLISDYLSKARTSRLDGSSPAPPVAIVPPKAEDITVPGKELPEPRRIASNDTNSSTGPNPGSTTHGPVVIQNGRGTRSLETSPINPPETGSQAIPASTPAVETDDKLYTIAEGDTLYQIARKQYKDPTLHAQLAKYNNIRADGLKVGTQIKLPTVEKLTGKLSKPKTVEQPLSAEAPRPLAGSSDPKFAKNDAPDGIAGLIRTDPATVAKPELPGRSYTIKSGDSLGLIASRELGSSRRADEIQELNSSLIKDPTRLKVGTVLKLPAK